MKFRTVIEPVKAPFSLDPHSPVVLLGSCFSDNIAERMRGALWDAANPLGTLYNPLSIARSLSLALSGNEESFRKSLAGKEPRFSWLFDSRMSAYDDEICLHRFRDASAQLRLMLKRGETLCVTFGTAWVYSLINDADYVVGNCHKQSASLFRRRRLKINEIADCWNAILTQLKRDYPKLKVIFTVSPVRHLKDGCEGNACSKAVLRLAVEQIVANHPYAFYFPAYELLNDDLRDYRFYASDLIHPSEQAVAYIWEYFRTIFLNPAGESSLQAGEQLARAFAHRPLVADDERERLRMEVLRQKAEVFARANPGMLIPEFKS